jgi:hypothetical protein
VARTWWCLSRLDVVVTSPAQPSSDTTNYLGGIGDVLEDRPHRSGLLDLGELALVTLYRNDRLIHEICYRWDVGDPTHYSVRIWIR